MRIALVAYGCEPGRGSEFGVGWTWAREIRARGHEVVVYTFGEQREAIEAHPDSRLPGLSFRYHRPRNWPIEHRNRAVHQIQYSWWQWTLMDRIANDALKTPFDLVHFITWGGIRMPVFGWRLQIPYVVGPVGGGEEAPIGYVRSLGFRTLAKEMVRNLINRWNLVDPLLAAGYGLAFRNFAKTRDSRRLVSRFGRHKCQVMLEIGANPALLSRPPRNEKRAPGPIRLICVSRLLYWKAPLTAVAVYAELLRRGIDAEFTLIGTGPDEAHVRKAMAALPPRAKAKLILEIPQADLFELMSTQDLALFTSLHDSSGNFVLESMALGVPVVALALGGPAELLRGGGGVLVDVRGKSHSGVVAEMADAIQKIAAHPEQKSHEARICALAHTWAAVVGELYGAMERDIPTVLPKTRQFNAD